MQVSMSVLGVCALYLLTKLSVLGWLSIALGVPKSIRMMLRLRPFSRVMVANHVDADWTMAGGHLG